MRYVQMTFKTALFECFLNEPDIAGIILYKENFYGLVDVDFAEH
jgi:hypothetical protein